MYQSPITQMLDEMKIHYEDGVYKAVQHVGFDVDKEELAKALQYDRQQYTKGYKDGYAKAIEDIFKIMDNAEAHSSDWDEHGLYYWVGFLKNRIESELKGKE